MPIHISTRPHQPARRPAATTTLTQRFSDIDRRALLAGIGALAIATSARPAFALTAGEAQALVVRLVDDINAVIASGKPEPAMIADFERIFATYADVNVIALSCLGPAARTASEAEKAAYVDAFRGYIARKYGKRFREFIGGRIEVNGTQQVKTWIEVISTAHLRNESPFEVKFLVSDRSGRAAFFDMFIEGISMRISERSEIGVMLDARRGDISQLTADLRRMG